VEYLTGVCTEEQHRRFLEICPEIEQFVVDVDGIVVSPVKLKRALICGRDQSTHESSEIVASGALN
jgi:hypothetical protein